MLESTPLRLVLVVPDHAELDDSGPDRGRRWSVVKSDLQGLIDPQESWLVVPFTDWATARASLLTLLAQLPHQEEESADA